MMKPVLRVNYIIMIFSYIRLLRNFFEKKLHPGGYLLTVLGTIHWKAR